MIGVLLPVLAILTAYALGRLQESVFATRAELRAGLLASQARTTVTSEPPQGRIPPETREERAIRRLRAARRRYAVLFVLAGVACVGLVLAAGAPAGLTLTQTALLGLTTLAASLAWDRHARLRALERGAREPPQRPRLPHMGGRALRDLARAQQVLRGWDETRRPEEGTPGRELRIPQSVVDAVWLRDGVCVGAAPGAPCDRRREVDHEIPLRRGGDNYSTNLRACCHRHRQARRSRRW